MSYDYITSAQRVAELEKKHKEEEEEDLDEILTSVADAIKGRKDKATKQTKKNKRTTPPPKNKTTTPSVRRRPHHGPIKKSRYSSGV